MSPFQLPVVHPAGAWNGLLLPYTLTDNFYYGIDEVTNTYVISGNIGSGSYPLGTKIKIWQYLYDPWGGYTTSVDTDAP